jgi:Sigma-70, region 4
MTDLIADPFIAAWETLTPRDRTVLELRLSGATLDQAGVTIGLTRERIRQIQVRSEKALLSALDKYLPDLRTELHRLLDDHAAVAEGDLYTALATAPSVPVSAALRALGVARPRTWAGDLAGWWTLRPGAVDVQLRDLAAQAPFADDELTQRAAEIGMPQGLPLRELLGGEQSPLTPGPAGGWVRYARPGADAAYLWLKDQAEPGSSAEIAAAAGSNEHALREVMRRDPRFAQRRPEGTWVLSEWKTNATIRRYANAVDAVVEVLGELGPLKLEQLTAETIQRYPVSAWRITQCLSSYQIGLTQDGRYDLTERGAIPVEESEPCKPDNMAESGFVIAVRLPVTHDVMRGSGICVNRWLTWRMDLHHAPSERYFELSELTGTITVRRRTSTSAISSLRSAAMALGMVQGCQLIVVFRIKHKTADVRHACHAGSCPAGLQ